jgi:hypothetical protein
MTNNNTLPSVLQKRPSGLSKILPEGSSVPAPHGNGRLGKDTSIKESPKRDRGRDVILSGFGFQAR